jgi:hypothetical protein
MLQKMSEYEDIAVNITQNKTQGKDTLNNKLTGHGGPHLQSQAWEVQEYKVSLSYIAKPHLKN